MRQVSSPSLPRYKPPPPPMAQSVDHVFAGQAKCSWHTSLPFPACLLNLLPIHSVYVKCTWTTLFCTQIQHGNAVVGSLAGPAGVGEPSEGNKLLLTASSLLVVPSYYGWWPLKLLRRYVIFIVFSFLSHPIKLNCKNGGSLVGLIFRISYYSYAELLLILLTTFTIGNLLIKCLVCWFRNG